MSAGPAAVGHSVLVADVTAEDRAAWLEARRGGIGGSDAAAIVGLSPWQSAYSLWCDKVYGAADSGESEAMRWGRLLEDPVADEYAVRTGYEVTKFAGIVAHPDHPFMYANPDRVVRDGDTEALLEVKTTSAYNAGEWSETDAPAQYLVQVQHYLAVCGLPWCDLAVLLGGQTFHSLRVFADGELIGWLIDREAAFWELVDRRTPPPVDGHEMTTAALKALYGTAVDIEIGLPATAGAVLAERAHVAGEIKTLTGRKNALDNQLREWLGEATVGVIDGRVAVTWKPVAGRVDTKALREAHPDIAAQFTGSSTRRLDVKASR